MLISSMSFVKSLRFGFDCSQIQKGELEVMLTHGYWHNFTVLILKCEEVIKIYRDHPYGLKLYNFILPYCFILHNTIHFITLAEMNQMVKNNQRKILKKNLVT